MLTLNDRYPFDLARPLMDHERRRLPRTLTGYAHVFGGVIHRDGVSLRFAPGAFEACLRRGDNIRFLVGHDDTYPFGSTETGLRLLENVAGLRFEFDVPWDGMGWQLAEKVRHRLLTGMSMTFTERESHSANGLKTITRADITEITATDRPAYQATTIGIHGEREPPIVPCLWRDDPPPPTSPSQPRPSAPPPRPRADRGWEYHARKAAINSIAVSTVDRWCRDMRRRRHHQRANNLRLAFAAEQPSIEYRSLT